MPDGVLTTIDVEHEHQRIARRIFVEAGFAPSRTRIITGRALDVLPRLADGVYDLVFVDADATEFGACADAALRLLRPGGVLIVNGALAGGRIGDPSARDVDTLTIRETIRTVRESEEWIPALIPSGAGLLAAVGGRRRGQVPQISIRAPQPVAPLVSSPSDASAQAGAGHVQVRPVLGPVAEELAQEQGRRHRADPARRRAVPVGDVAVQVVACTRRPAASATSARPRPTRPRSARPPARRRAL